MTTTRRVVGHSSNGPGCIAALALAIAQEAKAFGLDVKENKLSRSRSFSPSRYLSIADSCGRLWQVRVSNHYRPSRSPFAPPHFDLVSLDGSSGLAEVRRFLAEASSGSIAWKDLSKLGHRPRRRRKPNRKRLKAHL